jgi:hypothetical protein
VRNPLGAISPGFSFATIQAPYFLVLVSCVALCVASVLIRYRRSGPIERAQLKWFLYACAVLLLLYILILGFGAQQQRVGWWTLVFDGAILLIPLSIGISILRYHLWDIDLIIRRTLVYSILTALLALFYFGSVVVLQQLLRLLTGAGNDLAVILSTLAIAALFLPLRSRIQQIIDRRFYRRKYDAARVLEAFGANARNEVDISRLTEHLLSVVQETVQPATVSVWLTERELKMVGKGRGNER